MRTLYNIFLLCLFAFSSNCAFADKSYHRNENLSLSDYHEEQQVRCETKIYLSPDQLIITDKEISFFVGDELYSTPQLLADNEGIYVLLNEIKFGNHFPKCPRGHMITCEKCGGCASYTCQHGCHCKR